MRGNPQVRIAQEQDGAALEPTASREGPTATASGIAAAQCRLHDAGRGSRLRSPGRIRLQLLRRPRRADRPAALPRAARARPGAGQAPGAARPRPAPGPGGRHPSRFRGDALRLPVRRPGGGAAARRGAPGRPRGLHPPPAQAHARLRGGRRLRPAGVHRLPARGHRRPAAHALGHHGRVHGARRSRRAAAAARGPRALLPPVHLRQHALPARDDDHPGGRDGQPEVDLQPRLPARRRRSLLLLAAVLPRHGPGRHRARLRRHAALGRLPADPRLRDAAAPVADADLAQSLHRLVQPAVRLHPVSPGGCAPATPRRSTSPPGASPASAPR